jgi:hypothetical protein
MAGQTYETPLAGGVSQEAIQKTDHAIIGTGTAEDKAFAMLRAQFALRGHTLHRTHPADGPQASYAERWSMVRTLPTLEHVRAFLAQIGGAA